MAGYGILIRYDYSGDEADWQAAIDGFVQALNGDSEVGGRFSYSVNILPDGVGRAHVGRWDNDETLSLVQSRDYFKAFAGQVQGFAGGELEATRFTNSAQTSAGAL